MTPEPDEVERLSQAIALAEGFQLLVLECHSFDSWIPCCIFDAVQARVAALRGVPPLIMMYSPYVVTGHEGSLRDEAWVEAVLEPILELSTVALAGEDRPWPSPEYKPEPGPPAIEGGSLVAVLDGTAADERGDAELASWAYLFHRINERRNALTREFSGTFALALPPRLVRLFYEEAPDAASIRSGHFVLNASAPSAAAPPRPQSLLRWYPPHLVREAALRRLACDPRLTAAARHDLLRDLHQPEVERFWHRNSIGADLEMLHLLLDLFSRDELRRLAEVYLAPELARELPGSEASAHELADELLGRVDRGGPSMRRFFEYLVRERPHRYEDIARVASRWGHEVLPRKAVAVHTPSELFEALVRLPRERLEQVVLLAGLAGAARPTGGRQLPPLGLADVDEGLVVPRRPPPTPRPVSTDGPTRGDVLHLQGRARLPARTIVERAAAEGPEALQRLSEALEIVASRDARE